MRDELAKRLGTRGPFSATFVRTGISNSDWGKKVTMLFRDVRDEAGTQVTDHLWFLQGKQARELRLKPGERVNFVATVGRYTKRNPDRDFDPDEPCRVRDYRLIYPSNMRRQGEKDFREWPLFAGEQEL